ncbi:aminoacyl-tRNA hydrolase [Oxalobacter paraformigenes]|uniref:Peptidyl-tRNA hydrolase n=1 Tax=Oxalobacter paraformigenes TaxID=556268 RepID=C3X6B2_9BURK|nr:aminoacyl-tRNA hydrolase [Oxalobacter paraformigenes]EEO28748.1 peptidyl-tRNA hydrolase [Oxalobacter paraformigenes]
MSIRLIVGLGNPGAEYEQTRHNAGFWFVDNLENGSSGVRWQKESKFSALVAKTKINGADVWLMKPQTFMNRSGLAVGAIARFFKIASDEILVVHDELDILPGNAKLKRSGSTGGHNGLKDIAAALGTQDFWRLRIGIGHPRSQNTKAPVIDYVLQRPRREDQDSIDDAIGRALQVVPMLCRGEFDKAMKELHTVR